MCHLNIALRPWRLGDFRTFCLENHRSVDPAWLDQMEKEHKTICLAGEVLGITAEDRQTGQVLGFGVAHLPTPEFSERIVDPGFGFYKTEAKAMLERGSDVFYPQLDHAPELFARDNARSGIHLHLAEYCWASRYGFDASISIQTAISMGFLQRFRGMNVRRFTIEVHDSSMLQSCLRNGLRISRGTAIGHTTGAYAMMEADRSCVREAGNPWICALMGYEPQVLNLSYKQRRILYHANAGLSDVQIAGRVFLSPKSMKKTWDRIFEAAMPHVSSHWTSDLSKRQALLAYVSSHMFELWPAES